MEKSSDIPFVDFSGNGPDLHFAHANGFPVETYRLFLKNLTGSHHVLGMQQRMLWPGSNPTEMESWHDLAGDLIRFLGKKTTYPVVGVGHSMGGVVTSMASIQRPDLFRAICLIDPVFLSPGFTHLWKIMKLLGLQGTMPLSKMARRRKVIWDNREEVFGRYSKAPAFENFHPDVLADYITHGFAPDEGGGVRLRYPVDWEARIFESPPDDHWSFLKKVKVPCIVLRGENSDTLLPAAWNRLQKVLPHAIFYTIPQAGHLVPMEKPNQTAEIVLSFLSSF